MSVNEAFEKWCSTYTTRDTTCLEYMQAAYEAGHKSGHLKGYNSGYDAGNDAGQRQGMERAAEISDSHKRMCEPHDGDYCNTEISEAIRREIKP